MHWRSLFKVREPKSLHGDLLPVKSSRVLLSEHTLLIERIKRSVGVPVKYWQHYYQPCFENFALYAQQFSASEAHHHAHPGGLLEHSLEVVENALKLRQGKLLPAGAEAEDLVSVADLWTFATVSAALLHDIAKPAVDVEVTLFDAQFSELGRWSPWHRPGFNGVAWYRARYQRKRYFGLHEQTSLLIAPLILPGHCLGWLNRDLEVLSAWSATLLGDSSKAGALGEIIHQADGLSVARNLSGSQRSIQMPSAQQIPLCERLLTGLRYLLDHQKLPLNTDGAAGWLASDELWLVVKRALDELKSHLAGEGQTGIPGRNERLMDEFQQNGLLVPNPQGQAIWKARVFCQGWPKAHTLTMLRFPVAIIWPDEGSRPLPFEGSINVEIAEEKSAIKPSKIEDPSSVIPIPVNQTTEIESESKISEVKFDTVSNKTPNQSMGNDLNSRVDKDTNESNTTNTDETEEDQGVLFLQWLRKGLRDKTLSINIVHARIHTVEEGILLVSPGIFKDYNLAGWSHVQKRFQKLKLNEKTGSKGENIHHYYVDGPRRKNRLIKGFLITDTAGVFPGIILPSPNPHLRRRSEDEGESEDGK